MATRQKNGKSKHAPSDWSKTHQEAGDPIQIPEVHFYRASERPYGAFSNLYQRSFVFEGRNYPTSEHAYQAGKARKDEVREWVLSAPSPALVAMAAHGLYTWDIVSDWSRIKLNRMRAVLRAKFTQHEDLRKLLLSTGSARLVEAGTVDNAVNRFWGEVRGKGKNMLGVLLMELRAELHKGLSTRAKQDRNAREKIVHQRKSTSARTN